ncbi:MAG: hypothetical protein NTY25_11040 [Planctomycetia bacterium]|nr:hypothetical protein [Planctomycetia bacterium]
MRARSRAVAARCAAMVAGGIATIVLVASVSVPALADPVSPWATGGTQTKLGDNDGKPSVARIAQVPVSQAHAMPGTVVQGGVIPQGWQPQAVPYQAVGPDGRPVTMYYAPTYVFTYPIGPSIAAPAATRPPSAVNRRQAYGQPAANGWNYQTQGAIPPPVYALPPSTTARYQPAPYQFPAGANALGGTPLLPPTSAKPAAATPQFPPQFPPPSQQQSPPLPPNSLSPPPTQWVPASPDALPDSSVPAQPVSSVPSLSGDSAPPNPTASRAANAHLWRVVGVYDGDTITCIDDTNTQQKIRMAEIDAPELGQPRATLGIMQRIPAIHRSLQCSRRRRHKNSASGPSQTQRLRGTIVKTAPIQPQAIERPAGAKPFCLLSKLQKSQNEPNTVPRNTTTAVATSGQITVTMPTSR